MTIFELLNPAAAIRVLRLEASGKPSVGERLTIKEPGLAGTVELQVLTPGAPGPTKKTPIGRQRA